MGIILFAAQLENHERSKNTYFCSSIHMRNVSNETREITTKNKNSSKSRKSKSQSMCNSLSDNPGEKQ